MNNYVEKTVSTNELFNIIMNVEDGDLKSDEIMHNIYGVAETRTSLRQQRMHFFMNDIYGSLDEHTIFIKQ